MKKSKRVASIVCCVLFFALVILALVKLGKPTVRVYHGFFFPRDVYGPQVAVSKKMPPCGYPFKVLVINVYNFKPRAYKDRNPKDIVLGDGHSAVILAHDLSGLRKEIFDQLRIWWVVVEIRDHDGKIMERLDNKYLGIF